MRKIIIVGGGVLGLLCARELIKRGFRIVLLDAASSRPPASWAGGGILSPLYPWRYPDALARLTAGARDYYADLDRGLLARGLPGLELNDCGMEVLDEPAAGDALSWARRNRVALEVREDSLWLPEVAAVRNPRLLSGLRKWLVEADVQWVDAAARQIDNRGNQSRVRTDAGEFVGDHVLICAGAWSAPLLQQLGLRLPLFPVKGQMLRYRLECGPDHILLGHGGYIVPRGDGSWLVGSTVEKDEFDQRPTRMGYDRLISIGQRLWPAMQDVSPVAHWAGIRPGSEQRLPWLGEVPGHQGVFLACGHYRNGLVSAPGSACLLARLISGDAADVDPEPFAIPASAAVG